MKLKIILLCFIALTIFLGLAKRPVNATTQLANEIDKVVAQVDADGIERLIKVDLPSYGDQILICPPYSSPKGFKNNFSDKLIDKIEKYCVSGYETGYLLTIENDSVKEYSTLSYSAEPILGWSAVDSVEIRISKQTTAGRPIRLELLKAERLVPLADTKIQLENIAEYYLPEYQEGIRQAADRFVKADDKEYAWFVTVGELASNRIKIGMYHISGFGKPEGSFLGNASGRDGQCEYDLLAKSIIECGIWE